jgi:hypothetical protein
MVSTELHTSLDDKHDAIARSAAMRFGVIASIVGLLSETHKKGQKCRSVIARTMTLGESPQPTGGYEIHITIDPPENCNAK